MSVLRFAVVSALVCVSQTAVRAQSVSLTFEDALVRAREQSPSVLVARARIEEARGRLVGARIRYRDNPTFDFAAGPRSVDGTTLTDIDLGVSQLFETGGQRAARMSGAEAEIRRETATANEASRVAVRDVALAWLRTLHAQERVALLSRAETVAADVASVANRRYAAGDIAVLDVNVAKSALARGRAARMAAEAERSAASGELQRLLGLPRGQQPTARGELRRVVRADMPSLVSAVENRPDLQVLREEIASAAADVRLGQASTRPDVGVGARVKREEGHTAVIGEFTLALPAFARGQELFATGTARGSRARLELETRRVAAVSEIETLLATRATREAAVAAFEEEALPDLDENESLVQRSFDVGQISLPEVLLIRRELIETRLEYLDRQLEAAEAAVTLDSAAGVLR
jgi:cobalt-zinc-cadmium efflux system outer membrane protein